MLTSWFPAGLLRPSPRKLRARRQVTIQVFDTLVPRLMLSATSSEPGSDTFAEGNAGSAGVDSQSIAALESPDAFSSQTVEHFYPADELAPYEDTSDEGAELIPGTGSVSPAVELQAPVANRLFREADIVADEIVRSASKSRPIVEGIADIRRSEGPILSRSIPAVSFDVLLEESPQETSDRDLLPSVGEELESIGNDEDNADPTVERSEFSAVDSFSVTDESGPSGPARDLEAPAVLYRQSSVRDAQVVNSSVELSLLDIWFSQGFAVTGLGERL